MPKFALISIGTRLMIKCGEPQWSTLDILLVALYIMMDLQMHSERVRIRSLGHVCKCKCKYK